MKNKLLLLISLPILLITGCKDDEVSVDQDAVDEEIILQYIEDNNLTTQSTAEGLYYTVEAPGSGVRPTIDNEVTVHYKGYLLDGTKFDSSFDRGQPTSFPLRGVIKGWQIGIPLYKEGGKGTLLIPSSLAYGNNPPPGSPIPSNAVLAFDIELIQVK